MTFSIVKAFLKLQKYDAIYSNNSNRLKNRLKIQTYDKSWSYFEARIYKQSNVLVTFWRVGIQNSESLNFLRKG